MAIRFVPYESQHIPLVRSFNARLATGNAGVRFPESHIPQWLPPIEGQALRQEYFLAVEDDYVRGGYILKYQDFWINGTVATIADYRLPISEGVIDGDYADLGIRLTLDAIRREPRLFALGMGGFSERLPKLLIALRWGACEIPFYFIIVNPTAFLKEMVYLRKTVVRRIVLDVLAYSRIGWLGVWLIQNLRQWTAPERRERYQVVEEFGPEVDELWEKVRHEHALIAVRNQDVLRRLYPKGDGRFTRLAVSDEGQYLGWAVVMATRMTNHNYFGSMVVGSIVDCLAHQQDGRKVLWCAQDWLSRNGVDLIVANHSHAGCAEAFQQAGFLRGPSNFLFAASPRLSETLHPFDKKSGQIYFMRGDGDGPIHL